jgi:homoserine kinase type II
MSGYGDLGEQVISMVLAEYRLGGLLGWVPIERGYVNEKWRLDTESGLYLLKRRHPSLGRPFLVHAQHALVRHLRKEDLPVPALAHTRDGKTTLSHEGQIYELQAYVAGDPFDPADAEHLAASARMLGSYHRAVRGFDHEALHRPLERYGAAALSRTVKSLLETWRFSETTAKDSALLRPLVQELDGHVRDLERSYQSFGQLPELVIHGDYHGANLVFRDHRIVAVVDYDLAHWCPRAMEVAEAIIAFCTEPELELEHVVYRGALDLTLVDRFLTNYLEEALLSEAEIEALPDMIRTIWLCASLDPPLKSPLSRSAAPQALPEVLALADWAVTNRSALVEAGLAVREARATRPNWKVK